jgi:hypothetical protein
MAIRIDERLRLDEPSLAIAARSYFLRTLVEDVEFFIVADDSATPQHVPVRYGLQHISWKNSRSSDARGGRRTRCQQRLS